MKARRLIKAIINLNKEVSISKTNEDITFSSYIRDEYAEIIAEFIEEIYYLSNLNIRENKFLKIKELDTNALRDAIGVIQEGNPQEYTLIFSEENKKKVIPDELIKSLDKEIEDIEENHSIKSPFEIGFKFELLIDRFFTDLMYCLKDSKKATDKLIELVRSKLDLIDNDEILILWSQLKNQFSEDPWDRGYIRYEQIIPKEFFNTGTDIDSIRERYAQFVTKYKSLTIVEMIKNGIFAHPAGMIGIGKILSLNPNAQVEKISNFEVSLVRTVSKIVALYKGITLQDEGLLAKSLGVNPNSFIFTGYYFNEYDEMVSNDKISNIEEVLITLMERAIEYAEELSIQHSDISQALWQYKLGQEVVAPLQTGVIKKTKEVNLQKQLSKFLIERNIISFGRTFGRCEIDLFTKNNIGENFIIEVKKYLKNPTESKIRSDLVQLLSYMDQINQPKGILAIYNCTDRAIVSPRHWFNGRLWIVAMNVGNASPSKRKEAIELISSNDPSNPILFTTHGITKKKKLGKKSTKKQVKKSGRS